MLVLDRLREAGQGATFHPLRKLMRDLHSHFNLGMLACKDGRLAQCMSNHLSFAICHFDNRVICLMILS